MTLGNCELNLHPFIRQESEVEGNYGLVVDGASLQMLLEFHKDEFYAVCRRCIAVVCCRMSPKQKAEVCLIPCFSSIVIKKFLDMVSKATCLPVPLRMALLAGKISPVA